MASWEDELDLDLSHIWQPEPKAPDPHAKPDDALDDLAFPSQAPPATTTATAEAAGAALSQRIQSLQEEPQIRVTRLENAVVTRLQSENAAVTRLQSGNGNLEDIADAPTQVASLSAEPFVSRGGGLTVPLATKRLPPLPSFQAVVSRESGDTVPIATQRLESEHSKHRYSKGSGGDIRNYFFQGGGGPRKKARIPGPVGDLLLKNGGEEERGGGGGGVVGERVEEGGDRVFRKGAWKCALQSLNVEEFDPARYTILNVTASSIGSSRLNQRVPHFVAVIKELTPNVFGDAAVILKDPTGTVAGMMNNKVFSNTDFARAISPGAVVVLKQVAVFSPSAHYLNITIGNVVQVFPANTDLPQGSAPKQEPLFQKEQPPQPKRQPSPPQLLQPLQPRPTPLPSPQQAQPRPSPPQQAQPRPLPPQQAQPRPSPPQQAQPRPSPPQQAQPRPSPPQQAQPRPSPPQQAQPRPSPPQQAQPQPSPPQKAQPQPSPLPREPTKATAVAAKTGSWDLLSPSPPKEPSPPQEPSPPNEGITAAAKMAGWGDLTDDMEALLNEDVDDFYK